MDAEILTTITGVAGATKATIEAIRAALTAGKGRAVGAAAQEALGLVGELQTRILQLQEIAFRLHQEKAQALEESAQLRAQIRQKEEGAADRERYEMHRVRQSVVMVPKNDPTIYLCATCFEAGQKVYLTKLDPDFQDVGTHLCPKCQGIVGAP